MKNTTRWLLILSLISLMGCTQAAPETSFSGESGLAPAQPAVQSSNSADTSAPAVPMEEGAPEAMTSQYYSPLADGAALTLSAEFPPTSGEQRIYQMQPANTERTPAEMQEIARQWGASDVLYSSVYLEFAPHDFSRAFAEDDDAAYPVPLHVPPDIAPDSSLFEATPEYFAFGNDTLIRFSRGSVSLQRMGYGWAGERRSDLPVEEQVRIATEFLAAANLLPDTYSAERTFGSQIMFRYVIDETVMQEPFATIDVDENGAVGHAFINQFEFANTDVKLLISAETAWQELSNADNLTRYLSFMQPPLDEEGIPEMGFDNPPYWTRDYAVGEQVTLYTWPTIYRPIDGSGAMRMQADQHWLNFGATTFEEIQAAAASGQVLNVKGVVVSAESGTEIEVTDWQIVAHPDERFEQGTFGRDAEGDYLILDDGSRLALAKAPEELENGATIDVFGFMDDAGRLQWQHINVAFDDSQLPIAPASAAAYEGGALEPATAITIERIELRNEAYYPDFGNFEEAIPMEMPVLEEGEIDGGDMMIEEPMPSMPMIDEPYMESYVPMWIFSGTADNGATAEFRVLAVDLTQP